MKITAGVGLCSASARATPMPSSPGIAMSSSSRSGPSASDIRTVLSPSVAVPTRSIPSHLASSSWSRSAASGSSSAIRTRNGPSDIRTIQRQGQEHAVAAVAARAVSTTGERSEARVKSLADVGYADPGAMGLAALGRCRAAAGVRDLDGEAAGASFPRGDAQGHLIAGLRDRMLDHIFDDRLEQQRRQARRFELLGDIELGLEPAREADLLDVEIEPLQRNLLSEADVGG